MRYGYHRYARKVFLGALNSGSRNSRPKKTPPTREEIEQGLIGWSCLAIFFIILVIIF